MRLIYHQTATPDLAWFRRYYSVVFPEGRANARRHFELVRQALLDNPLAGAPTEENPEVRQLGIPRTPFSFVYSVRGQTIIVLRLWDARSRRPQKWM